MSNILHKAIELLKELEGLYLIPYQCPAGKWTIGYGHNLESNGLKAEEAKRVDFDVDAIGSDRVGVWRKSGLSVKEVKSILPKYLGAIKISKETAEFLLDNETNNFFKQLSQYDYFTEAPENVQIALICICFQCGFVGMNKYICIAVKQWSANGSPAQEKKYFIDYIKQGDYCRASGVLRHATIFNTTKKRALKMAELIYSEE